MYFCLTGPRVTVMHAYHSDECVRSWRSITTVLRIRPATATANFLADFEAYVVVSIKINLRTPLRKET